MRIIDTNINEQSKALYRANGGGNMWRELGEKGKEQVLTEAQILELSELIVKIENHYSFPCDIEWAFEDGKFYIVQSRPITTLRGVIEKPKFTILAEDYDVPLCPWYILNEEVFGSKLRDFTNDEITLDSLFVFEKDRTLWGCDINQFQKAADYFNFRFDDAEFSQKIISEHYRLFKEAEQYAQHLLQKDFSKESNATCFEAYKKFYDISSGMLFWGLFIQFADMGEKKLSDVLKKEILLILNNTPINDSGNAEAFFSKLITPVKETFLYKESVTVLELTSKIKLDKRFCENVTRHDFSEIDESYKREFEKIAKEYGWMQYYYIGPKANANYYFDLVRRKLKMDISAELQEKKIEKEHLISTQSACEKLFSKNQNTLLGLLREFSFLKELRKEMHYRLNDAMDLWFQEIEKRFGWRPIFGKYVFLHEYESFLVGGGSVPRADDLEKRYNLCAYLLNGNETRFVVGNEAENVKKLFIPKIEVLSNSSDVIKGSVAVQGKAKGFVKIVNKTSDLEKFNEGDILVSFATNPSLVPAMNKAGAIITNTGGITCHAAIVARELKIPCIIGTKIATQVLHDGDLVEVDADNGVVRVIERANAKDAMQLSSIVAEKEEWIFMWGTAPIVPSFYACPDAQVFRRDILSSFPHRSFQYFDGTALTNYMPKSEVEQAKQDSKHLFVKPADYQNYVLKYEKEYAVWWKWVRGIERKDYAQTTRDELAEDHLRFTEFQRDAIGYFGSTRPEPNFAVEQGLEHILKEKFGNVWPDRFGLLTTPLVLDDVQKQQLALAKLAGEQDLSDETTLAHASQFPWLVFGQFDEKKIVEYIRHLIDTYEGLSYEQACERQKAEKEKIKHEQDALFTLLAHDAPQARHFAAVLEEHAVRRMDIKAFWVGSYFLTRNFWKKLAEELGVDIWDFFKYLMPSEIDRFLKNESEKNIREIIEERTQSYAIICDGKNIEVLGGSVADKAFQETVHRAIGDGKEIKGQTAVLGRYTGKVRKVMPGDLDSLQKSTAQFLDGEVLVTTMTQPNMVPIMKKAGAVVTDEGGITSHAAIVAREFKTPCIVGCLNAMQVLKDGDLVEVDADNGVVKIIT